MGKILKNPFFIPWNLLLIKKINQRCPQPLYNQVGKKNMPLVIELTTWELNTTECNTTKWISVQQIEISLENELIGQWKFKNDKEIKLRLVC